MLTAKEKNTNKWMWGLKNRTQFHRRNVNERTMDRHKLDLEEKLGLEENQAHAE